MRDHTAGRGREAAAGTEGQPSVPAVRISRRAATWMDAQARTLFLLPTVLMIVFLAIFPLFVSLYLSLTRFRFVPGGFKLTFVGLANYQRLLFGIERVHFLGALASPGAAHWVALGLLVALAILLLFRSMRKGATLGRATSQLIVAAVTVLMIWLLIRTVGPGGRPGTLFTTLIYVFIGITVQYWLGLGLAYLTSQRLPGRRFFRVVFLLPMMITPVGIAYTFRILMDLGKGPFAPLWRGLGLSEVSWVNYPWGARTAVMIGDVWQWTPLMFIVLLAALESQSQEMLEAAQVDGADGWQIFWKVTWPQLLPVTSTLILIRLIEGFKIIDLPNVLTNGGPGTATESLTLHAFMAWRTLDIGGSAAVANALLIVVTFTATAYIGFIHRRLAETV